MTEGHRHKYDEKTDRIVRWLYERREEFEQAGVSEGSIAAAVGLSESEVVEAVDRLENREAVVRLPQPDTTPPSFVLQQGRGWADICEELGKSQGAGGSA